MIRMIAMGVAALAMAGCSTMGQDIREKGRELNGNPLVAPADFSRRILVVDTDQRGVRRELILTLLAQSDRACEDYLVGMTAYRNQTSLGLDLASLGLSTVGGLIKPAETANILSSASTLTQSAERTAEENLFGGRTQALIYTAVRQGRETQRHDYMARLDAGNFDGWSAASIAAELDRYHLDCGVSYGLRELEAALARTDPNL